MIRACPLLLRSVALVFAFVSLCLFSGLLPARLVAQQRTGQQSAPPAQANSAVDLDRWVTSLVLRYLPHKYTRDKDWGHQTERWDGLKVRRDGLKIRTKRRKKLVNHGTWRKYSASLADPVGKFKVAIRNVRQIDDEKLAFQLDFTADLKLHARQAKWVKGVQMYSFSVDGKASIRLSVEMNLGVSLDGTRFPPGLVLEPSAERAEIIVDDFRIDRVSKLGGEFAQQMTRLTRRELDREIHEKEAELVEKINKEIDKNRDDLKISIADALGFKHAEKFKPLLPKSVQDAVQKQQTP